MRASAEPAQRDPERPEIAYDPAQARVATMLGELRHELASTAHRPWWRKVLHSHSAPRGLYIWGEVGRGKTLLMDRFYDALPFPEKRRLHFHRFMRATHEALKGRRHREDPLAAVAARWAQDARVICFDEFAVTDVADATILGRLLEKLFTQHVTLVATSNIQPDELYKNGLKRELFLPAIGAIKRHMRVVHCDSGTDYRLRQLSRAPLYHTPLGPSAERALEACFESLANTVGAPGSLQVEGREVAAHRLGDDGVAWFEFDVICGGPRSANDYIEVARLFHTVLVSNVPPLGRDNDDAARRFIALVDEFYDRNVKLALSAAAPIDRLYHGKRLSESFKRTMSRLVEMQSREYLARPHMP